MNASQVLAELFRLTGALWPVNPATVTDLEELRRRLAHSLFDMPGDGASSSLPAASDAAAHGSDGAQGHHRHRGARAHSAGPCAATLAYSSPRSPASQRSSKRRLSRALGGHAVQRTFGPMLEERERFVFFDLIEAANLLRVVRGGGAPFLLIPAGATSADGMTFTFGPGSVWIDARLVAPVAMGFTGLRVAGGTLTVRGVPSERAHALYRAAGGEVRSHARSRSARDPRPQCCKPGAGRRHCHGCATGAGSV